MRRWLIAVVAVLLVLVILAMRFVPREPVVAIVTKIVYSSPVTGGPPYLTYVLTPSLSTKGLAGRSAELKSFTVAAGSAASSAATDLVALLLRGGGLPFVPVWVAGAAVPTVTTNTIPIGAPAQSVAVEGQGVIWFV